MSRKTTEEAGPLLHAIERLRAQTWADVDGTLRNMAAANTVNSILQRQADATSPPGANSVTPGPVSPTRPAKSLPCPTGR
jgi:hypothetical protein